MENGSFYHEEAGYNFRISNILSVMGCAQLESIYQYIEAKRNHFDLYNSLLKDVKGITLPIEKQGIRNVKWLCSIVVEDDYCLTIDELIIKLKENGMQ